MLRVLILAAAVTGLRQSELLGMRWRDIDVDASRVRVRNAFVRGEHSSEGKSDLSTRRSVPMADWLGARARRVARADAVRSRRRPGLRPPAARFGLQTQWGLRISLRRLRGPDAMTLLERQGMPAVWRRSIAEALDVIDLLDARITPIDHELRPLARADPRVILLDTIPGIGDLLGLTLASEIGDVARFGSPRKLIGYAGLAPKISQSGDRSRTGALSKVGSRTLRWAAVEAAQHAWRPTNPWHQLYTDLAARAGKNPAKAAVARKILIAAWHILSRQQPFKPAAPRRPEPASASSRRFLAA